ncbi:hypothetical protein PMAYCL1PPCAC_21707, partial [Pristionchus mayeri]
MVYLAMLKDYVDELANQRSSMPSFDKFTLTSGTNILFKDAYFDVENPSPLSLLAWKLQYVESDTCSKFGCDSGTRFLIKWGISDPDVHKKMILLMRAYLSTGTRCACLEGNDYRSFCEVLVGVQFKQLELVIVDEVPNAR